MTRRYFPYLKFISFNFQDIFWYIVSDIVADSDSFVGAYHRIGWWENLQETPINLMVKPMVSCRFPLKPIHWAKRCGHCSWVSQLSQRHGLRHVGLMTIIHWANMAVGCVEQVYPLGSWENLVEFIGVSVCWIVIWCIIMLYSKKEPPAIFFGGMFFSGEAQRWISPSKWVKSTDHSEFSRPSGWSKWTRTPCGFLIGWSPCWWRRSSTTLLRPWPPGPSLDPHFFQNFIHGNVAPDVERWWKMWIVWKVKGNSKFWCDSGWKYWLDHLRRQMSTNDTNEPICSAFFSE